ncbi:hypothetical protein F503_05895 [Ophiostoma piceae UAMH 11346]|uniref:F-box domain-containing protein n=1 Tax=Ophiostoma piceae (strain UAMH 11346) TaxID=1262450 RepID=S3DB81_OPHP1|nr:hypothetical protein F503_05895 [Ophiostoma piceae UAMH 11346]
MTYATCAPAQACWPLINQGENAKRKSSKRPMFSRWKWLGKSRELGKEKDTLLDSRSTPPEAACSAPTDETRHVQCSVAKKFSQPVLRAISSACHFQLLRSLSDVDLRKHGGLADSYSQGFIPAPRVLHLPFQPPPPHAPPALPARRRPDVSTASEAQPRGSTPREMSRFLMLPQEIRDEIYAYVFYSTRLTMGRRVTCTSKSSRASPDSTYYSSESASSSPSTSPEPRGRPRSHHRRRARTITQIKPAKDSMALFRVCRQITNELRSDDAWLSQVLFNFEDAATMLDVLGSALTPVQRRLVREVRVREGGLFVHQRMPSEPVQQTSFSSSGPTPPSTPPHQQQRQPHQFRQRFLLLGGLMRLLPGLQLDRLTVLPALPCRIHKSTRCHNIPSVDMYSMSVNSNPPPPVNRAAPHEIFTELLHTGSGWRELCYVHHDTNMLAADRERPSSLEAMMVNMGFWDADSEAYNEVFAEAERAEQEEQERLREEAAVAATAAQLEPGSGSGIDALRRHGLGSLFTSYSARKEFRLPRWRHILTERDGLLSAANANNEPKPGSAAGWNVSIDAVIDEGFYEGETPHSTVSVYGVRDGQALWAMETLEDVHNSRIGHDDFMVVVRRAGDKDEKSNAAKRKMNGEAAHYVEAGAPYPFKEGDPRALGYGSRWETLRPVLFPWDHLTVTRCRRDRYQHRDEYLVRSQRRRH